MQMLKKLYSESVAKTGIETLPCSYSYIGHSGVKRKLIGEGGKRDMGENTTLCENQCVQQVENAVNFDFKACSSFLN